MGEQQPHPTGKSYQIGDVGAGARVAQGENITWTERFTGDPQGEALRRQFTDLLAQIERCPFTGCRELASADGGEWW
jgi:hypothetical protein